MTDAPPWLVELLVCPSCRAALRLDGDLLVHAGGVCDERYPVIDGIPRLLRGPARAALARRHARWFAETDERRALFATWAAMARAQPVIAGFDHEWARHPETGTPELRSVFELYADLVRPDAYGATRVVLDAGCGAGRWALEVARRGPRVIALDLGASVELAARNTAGTGRVGAVQADVHDCPIADGAIDWAYSLGVLHHVEHPAAALERIARTVRRPGFVLVYLYYALEGRGLAFRAVFRMVDLVRRGTSRLPRPLAAAFADAVALGVYWPMARSSALLWRAGARRVADALPLSFYRDRPLRVMRNDSLDRFGTRLERRYTREAFRGLLAAAGLPEVVVSDRAPYWHGIGRRGARE